MNLSDLINEQTPPAPSTGDVWLLVLKDMEARRLHGIEKYGQPLQPFNGRDPLIDAYQEALDLCVYLRQAIEERNTSTSTPDLPNHGPCAKCGLDVKHTYPWWTGTPGRLGVRPLHEECAREVLFKP